MNSKLKNHILHATQVFILAFGTTFGALYSTGAIDMTNLSKDAIMSISIACLGAGLKAVFDFIFPKETKYK